MKSATMKNFEVRGNFLLITWADRKERISLSGGECLIKGKGCKRWIKGIPENLWSTTHPPAFKAALARMMGKLPGRVCFTIELFPPEMRWQILEKLASWQDEMSLNTLFNALHENPVLTMALLADNSQPPLFSPLVLLLPPEDKLTLLGLPSDKKLCTFLKGMHPDSFSRDLIYSLSSRRSHGARAV